jgi:hypothetical protein
MNSEPQSTGKVAPHIAVIDACFKYAFLCVCVGQCHLHIYIVCVRKDHMHACTERQSADGVWLTTTLECKQILRHAYTDINAHAFGYNP